MGQENIPVNQSDTEIEQIYNKIIAGRGSIFKIGYHVHVKIRREDVLREMITHSFCIAFPYKINT